GWQQLHVSEIAGNQFTFGDPASGQKVQITQTEAGEIDVTAAQGWMPDALANAIHWLRDVSDPSGSPLLQYFRGKLDAMEGNVLQRAKQALTAVRDEKMRLLAESAQQVDDAVANPQAPAYEVPQADIDAIGRLLDQRHANPTVEEVPAAVLGQTLPELKERLL